MEREAFIARLREQLGRAVPVRLSAHGHEPGDLQAVARFRRPLGDPAAAFTAEAEALGARVRRVGPGGRSAFLEGVVREHGVSRAVVSRDPEAADTARLLGEMGVEVLPWDGPAAAAAADLGVTGALCGFAATGSVVVASDRAGGRTASLLPPVHAVLLRVSSLVATPGDFWRDPARFFPGGLPSQVVVITGPSRTADIEVVLVRGVHGPGHLWVGLLDE